MKPANFLYLCPESIEEAVSILFSKKEDAKIIAGGQSLLAMLNMRLLSPKVIIDIKNIKNLNKINNTKEGLWIGANTTQQELLEFEDLYSISPLLNKMLPWVGHYQTRNKGTICGSVAHADPSSEIPLCLALLDGKIKLVSQHEERILPARDFQKGLFSTASRPDEIIQSVLFPRLDNGVGVAFNEFSFRQGDFSIVSVGIICGSDKITFGLTGLTDTPYITVFPILTEDEIEDALNDLAWKLKGVDDHIAPASYRRNLLREIGKITIKEAMQCRIK